MRAELKATPPWRGRLGETPRGDGRGQQALHLKATPCPERGPALVGRNPHPQQSTHQRERTAVPRPPAPKPPESDRGRKLSHVNRGRPGLGFPALAGGLGTARPAPRPGVCRAPAGGAVASCAPLDPQRAGHDAKHAGRDAKPGRPCACCGSEITVRTRGRALAPEGCPSGAGWLPRGSSGGLSPSPPQPHTHRVPRLGPPPSPNITAGKGQA